MGSDQLLLEKLAHFNRERMVHARGAGAYGTFTCPERLRLAHLPVEQRGRPARPA
ncbi:catalase [Streptomyces sp. NPDC004270]